MPSQLVRTTVITDDLHACERGFPGSSMFLIDGVDPYGQPSLPAALACPRPPATGPFPTRACVTP